MVERAGVVDQDVDRAELLDGAVDRLLHLLAVGDVALDRRGAAAHALDLLGGRLGVDDPLRLRDLREDAVRLRGLGRLVRLDLDVGDHDVGAGAGERERVGAAEAARAARDEGDAPGEVDLDRHGAILRRVHRIDVEERRARLVTRHRLDPARARPIRSRSRARSSACTRPTRSPSSSRSRRAATASRRPTSSARSYEDRRLVRILAMRRTLWAVPRELLPVVFAAATKAVAATQRKRLEGFVRDSGISTRPGAWITRAGNAAVAAVAARGAAMTTEVTRDVPLLAKKLRFGSGKWVVEQSAGARVLPQMAMEGRLVRGRPRGSWISPQFRWVTTEDWLGGPIEELDVAAAQAELLRRWLAAFGPATETDMRWWTGWTARETRAALAAIPHDEVDLDGATGYVLDGDLEPTPPPEPSAALLPTLDPTTMGWKERGLVPRPPRPDPVRHERERGPDDLVGRPHRRRLEPAPRRRDRPRPARGRRPRRARRDRRRGRARAGVGRRRPLLPRLPAALPARARRGRLA